MRVLNSTYRVKLHHKDHTITNSLHYIYSHLDKQKTKLFTHRPVMLQHRHNSGITILIFNNLSVRTMGASGFHNLALHQSISHIPGLEVLEEPKLMTATVVFDELLNTFVNGVNLFKLSPTYFWITHENFLSCHLRH